MTYINLNSDYNPFIQFTGSHLRIDQLVPCLENPLNFLPLEEKKKNWQEGKINETISVGEETCEEKNVG